jgi:orotate phosphoribosyltransferase
MKEELIEMLCRKSFKYSDEPVFKLVSGQMSRFYVNCKPTTLDARGMYLVGQLIFDRIKGCHVSGIGGLTFGADPLAVATAFTSEINHQPIHAFSIRKTQKDHGIVKWVEGDVHAGERVAIVDIERARSEGLEVVTAVVLVDRQEGGLDNIREHIEAVSSIITRDELVERYKILV